MVLKWFFHHDKCAPPLVNTYIHTHARTLTCTLHQHQGHATLNRVKVTDHQEFLQSQKFQERSEKVCQACPMYGPGIGIRSGFWFGGGWGREGEVWISVTWNVSWNDKNQSMFAMSCSVR